jgi:DNA-binding NtrC family response regulator
MTGKREGATLRLLAGDSAAIQRVRSQIDLIGKNRSSVLIQGESGTGKELVARALHFSSGRAEFVPIDCSSLTKTLVESELFGHTRGAFTGATDARRGLIESASGGTAFFDEIGDMPTDLQVKLLRVIQEREIRPLGSQQWIKVDIRVISATHRDLLVEIAAGRFREDLYYRLNVVRICLPPLRERREDIPVLIERMLGGIESRYHVSPEAMEAMLAYDWPGNVRELRNCAEHMMALATSNILRVSDLPEAVADPGRAAIATSRGGRPAFGSSEGAGRPEKRFLCNVEREAILSVLAEANGSRKDAARILGIGRTTLYRKMKQYNCDLSGTGHSESLVSSAAA